MLVRTDSTEDAMRRNYKLYTGEYEIKNGEARMIFRPLATGGEVRIEERVGTLTTRDYRVDLEDGRKRYAAALAAGYRKA